MDYTGPCLYEIRKYHIIMDMLRSNLLSPSATSSFYSFLLKCNMNKIGKTSMGRVYKSCALKKLYLVNMFLILPTGVK